MSIYDEIFKLRDSAYSCLSRVNSLPKVTPYGFVYVATILVNGVAHAESFKFNPATYAGEDMDGILKKLVEKAGIVDDELVHVECTEGVMSYLFTPDDTYGSWRTYNNGVSLSEDRRTLTIPGTGIRYMVKNRKAERKSSNSNWNTLDTSVLVVINAVSEWKDPAVDELNKKAMVEWLVATAAESDKAQEHLTAMNALVCKAMTEAFDK